MNYLTAFTIGLLVGITSTWFVLCRAVRFINTEGESATKENLRHLFVSQLKVVLPAEKVPPPTEQFKLCPWCAEPMRVEAVYCRHCRKRSDRFQPQSADRAVLAAKQVPPR